MAKRKKLDDSNETGAVENLDGFTPYERKNVAWLRPLLPDETDPGVLDEKGISVSEPDVLLDGDKFAQGKVAVNPDDEKDQWYVNADYVESNFEPVAEKSAEAPEDKAGRIPVDRMYLLYLMRLMWSNRGQRMLNKGRVVEHLSVLCGCSREKAYGMIIND